MGGGHKHKRRYRAGFLGAGLLVVVIGTVMLTARPSLERWPALAVRSDAADGDLTMRFIGTSGIVLSDGADTVVMDGFVSRPTLWQLLRGRVSSDAAMVQQVMNMTQVTNLSALMVTHSHYDHAMDAASWVKQAGGEIWGTPSTQKIARAEGVDDARIVLANDMMSAGDFTVQFFELDHAPGEMMQGDVEQGFKVPAHANQYRTGGGLGFYITHGQCRILAVPSAGMAQDDLSQFPADVVLLSIGQLGLQGDDYIRRYWLDTVVASGAKLVIPIHWDDFTRSLNKPLRPLPYAVERIDRAMSKITALAGDQVIVALPVVFEPLDLSASGAC